MKYALALVAALSFSVVALANDQAGHSTSPETAVTGKETTKVEQHKSIKRSAKKGPKGAHINNETKTTETMEKTTESAPAPTH